MPYKNLMVVLNLLLTSGSAKQVVEALAEY
jgi:hypothetical protein